MQLTMSEEQTLDDFSQPTGLSNRKYVVAVCLSGIFGILGVQHFYLGRWALGFFDLGLSIIAFTLLAFDNPWGWLILGIDIVHTIYVTYKLLVGEFKDGNGHIVPYPGQTIH